MGYSVVRWFLLCCAVFFSPMSADAQTDSAGSLAQDSSALLRQSGLWKFQQQSFHPFMENADSAYFWQFTASGVGLPRTRTTKAVDPMSPYSKDLFVRQSSAKFWMFAVAIAWLLLLLYFRSAFPKQFEMRIKSLVSAYNFSELMGEKMGFVSAGTLLAHLLGWSVMGMVLITTWVYAQLLNLNSVTLYAVALVAILLWELFMYILALMFSEATGLQGVIRASWQRKANAWLWFGLLVYPLVLLAYYNAPKLQDLPFDHGFVAVVFAFFALRMLWVFSGMMRDGSLSLASVLYFCGIECLPLALIAKAWVLD